MNILYDDRKLFEQFVLLESMIERASSQELDKTMTIDWQIWKVRNKFLIQRRQLDSHLILYIN